MNQFQSHAMTRKKILIVEDDSVQTKIFEKIVNQINYKAVLVADGKQALAYLKDKNQRSEIGLILLDLFLPDISGLQVLVELRNMKNQIPIAMLSASEDAELIVEATKLGASDFFVKGKSHDEIIRLYEFIEEVMGQAVIWKFVGFAWWWLTKLQILKIGMV